MDHASTPAALTASRYDAANGRWGTEEVFDRAAGIAAVAFPAIASTPNGAAVVLYTQGDLLAGAVTAHARRSSAQSPTWDSPELVTRDRTPVGNTTLITTGVALNEAGVTFAVWQDQEDERVMTVWVNRYDPGSKTWSEGERLGRQEMELAQVPQVAVDPLGNAIATWSAYEGEHEQIWATRYRAEDERWTGPEILDSAPDADMTRPQIGVDEQGNAHVVWTRFGAEGQTLWVTRFDAGNASWDAATPLDLGTLAEGAEPKLVVSPSGEALLAWMSWDGGVYANHYRSR